MRQLKAEPSSTFLEEVGRFCRRDEFNVGLVQTPKERVTTHLPNGRQGCDAAFGVSLSEPASRADVCGRSGPFFGKQNWR